MITIQIKFKKAFTHVIISYSLLWYFPWVTQARVVELKGLLDANMKNYMSAIATGDLVWTNPTPFIAS